MGSFGGHALPGSFFMVYAMWVTISACIRWTQSAKRGGRFLTTVTFSLPPGCRRGQNWPLEAILKIALSTIGMSLEIITAMHGGHFTAIGNAQHATMFFYFAFSGLVDLLMHFKAPLPPNTDYIILTMAFMVEGLLFKFHLHGRTQLDILLHTLLIYAVYACIISIIVEMKYRHSILSPLARAYFIFLQGTWFWQVGYILYNPFPGAVPWKADDHNELTMATLYFAWHALVDFIIIVAVATVIRGCSQGWRSTQNSDMSMKRLIHSGSNGQTMVRLQEESESDLEFEQPLVNNP